MTTDDLLVRPLADGDLSPFTSYDRPGAGAAFGVPGRDFLATAAAGSYRPDWVWVAQRGDAVVARAAFWAGPEDTHPFALDWFDVAADEPDRVAVGVQLLRTALASVRNAEGAAPEYHLFLPPRWRDDPSVRGPADDRLAAARAVGYEPFVERLRLEWRGEPTVDAPPGETPSGALRLRPVGGDDELLAVLEAVIDGTLDAYSRRDTERGGVAAAAKVQLADMDWMPAPRDWWRLAVTPDGEVAGVVLPSRNYQAAVIGYVGVLPAHRGHGYAAELVSWATAFLAAQGADRVIADTDTGNAPMAAAFAKAGYQVTAQRIVLSVG